MPKFCKKPVVVDAEQWFPGKPVVGVYQDAPLPRETHEFMGTNPAKEEPRFFVTTAHGQRAFLAPGDWVITELDGEHYYPCKPDIFAAIYEAVEGK